MNGRTPTTWVSPFGIVDFLCVFIIFVQVFFCFVWLRFIVYRLLVDTSDRYMNGTFCTCLIGGIDYETITPFE